MSFLTALTKAAERHYAKNSPIEQMARSAKAAKAVQSLRGTSPAHLARVRQMDIDESRLSPEAIGGRERARLMALLDITASPEAIRAAELEAERAGALARSREEGGVLGRHSDLAVDTRYAGLVSDRMAGLDPSVLAADQDRLGALGELRADTAGAVTGATQEATYGVDAARRRRDYEHTVGGELARQAGDKQGEIEAVKQESAKLRAALEGSARQSVAQISAAERAGRPEAIAPLLQKLMETRKQLSLTEGASPEFMRQVDGMLGSLGVNPDGSISPGSRASQIFSPALVGPSPGQALQAPSGIDPPQPGNIQAALSDPDFARDVLARLQQRRMGPAEHPPTLGEEALGGALRGAGRTLPFVGGFL